MLNDGATGMFLKEPVRMLPFLLVVRQSGIVGNGVKDFGLCVIRRFG